FACWLLPELGARWGARRLRSWLVRFPSPLVFCLGIALLVASGCGDDADAPADTDRSAPEDAALRDAAVDAMDASRTLLDARIAPPDASADTDTADLGSWLVARSDADQAPIRAAFQRTSGALRGVTVQLGWDALDGQIP